MNENKLISLVVLAYNEEGNIDRCYAEITEEMAKLKPGYSYEVVFVDNRSEDSTPNLVREICKKDNRWRLIRFSRNFLPEGSMDAGLRIAKGDCAVVLFSDMQEPPSLIHSFIDKWEEGYDVVYGLHKKREGDSLLRKWLVKNYYRVIGFLSDAPFPPDAGDFRLIDRKVINALGRIQEKNRYFRGLSVWPGFRQIGIPYDRRSRTAGESKAPLGYMFSLAFRSICIFSVKPLRYMMHFGLAMMLFSFLFGVFTVCMYLIHGREAGGTLTLALLVLINLSFTSFCFGVLGEYIGHIYNEARGRPRWIIDETVNVDLTEDEKYGL